MGRWVPPLLPQGASGIPCDASGGSALWWVTSCHCLQICGPFSEGLLLGGGGGVVSVLAAG
jgi:hypothetical protein